MAYQPLPAIARRGPPGLPHTPAPTQTTARFARVTTQTDAALKSVLDVAIAEAAALARLAVTGAEALARRIHPALQAAHAAIRQLRPNAASPAISASILATIGALTLQLAPPTPQPVQVPTPPPQPAYTTSAQGVAFITRLETLPGVSERLHWPGGTSGVTLGAGYDLSARSRTQVMRDMLAIGLATRTARAIAAGAGLAGTEAARFAARNQDLVVLSASQQRKLLARTLPSYRELIARHVRVPLTQHQIDALTAIAYNPGGSFLPIAEAVNTGQLGTAAQILRSRVYSGRTRLPGLVHRREREIALLTTGRYS